jgi:hypothetical protein
LLVYLKFLSDFVPTRPKFTQSASKEAMTLAVTTTTRITKPEIITINHTGLNSIILESGNSNQTARRLNSKIHPTIHQEGKTGELIS